MNKRHIRNVAGLIIFFGHLICLCFIVLKWRSLDALIDVGAPLLPITAFAFSSMIKFSAENRIYSDDNDPALLLFSAISLTFPTFIICSNIVIIAAIDTNLLGPGITLSKGRALITWLETVLGGGYALIIEGLFQKPPP